MTGQKKLIMYGVLAAVVLLAGGALLQALLDDSGFDAATPMTFRWEPGSGTPAASYDVEIRKGGSGSTDITTEAVQIAEVTFNVDWLTPYEVRVRGVSATGVRGAWSEWSLVYDRDHDAPSF